MDEDHGSPALLIDIGSGFVKAGFSGDIIVDGDIDIDKPLIKFPTVVGNHPYEVHKHPFVGDETISKYSLYKDRTFPIERGIITHWRDFETILHDTIYNQLRCQPEEHSIALSSSPLMPKCHKQRLTRLMFEKLCTPCFYLCDQALASSLLYMYCNDDNDGEWTGIVLECGYGATHSVPIYQGYVIQHGINRMDLAGRDLNDDLTKLLSQDQENHCQGINIKSVTREQIVCDIKERFVYVSTDFESDMKEIEEMKDDSNCSINYEYTRWTKDKNKK